MNSVQTVLLIPAYCPNESLIRLVKGILDSSENFFSRIVIVDDGSGEKFAYIFSSLAQLPKVTIVKNAINLGKGAALKNGFNYIFTTGKESSVVTADADGQHTPQDILSIARAGLAGGVTLVLGVRKFDGHIPFRSWVGNQLTRIVYFIITGHRLVDTQTGLRAWPKNLALSSLRLRIDGYDFEMEALIRAKELIGEDVNIIQLPISTIYIDNNRYSHFNPVLDSMRIYFVFLRFCGAGLLTAFADNTVFILSYTLNNNIIRSQILSRLTGGVVSFIMSRQMVFQAKSSCFLQFVKFSSLVILFGYISYGMIYFLTSNIGMGVISAKILTEFFLFIGSFTIQREFIFRKPSLAKPNKHLPHQSH